MLTKGKVVVVNIMMLLY